MRIISGKYKGRAINPPRNLRARPTTDFAKENLFNVLDNLVDFEECDVLDLFAGTGSISYEFASRGARSVTSVEINPVHHNFIRQTAAQLGIERFYPVKANVFLYLKSCAKQFDIIFPTLPTIWRAANGSSNRCSAADCCARREYSSSSTRRKWIFPLVRSSGN